MSRTRREVLGTTAAAVVALATPAVTPALARSFSNELPWQPNEVYPPAPVEAGPLQFLSAEEASCIDAIVDRLIPDDELGPGGKAAGCTIFIDRQLAGPYGVMEGLYTAGPHPEHPLPTQGLQTAMTPREQYRKGLAALAAYCRATYAGRLFEQLPPADQDHVIAGLEKGDIKLEGFGAKALFTAVHTNAMEGFFADPTYGGNRDMAGWKLVGFPGTRYDYREVMDNPNKPYTRPPVAIGGRGDWNRSQ